MFALFAAAWATGAPAITTSAPSILWAGIEPTAPIAPDSYYVSVDEQPVTEQQATLRNGDRRYEAAGLLIIQVFCPRSDAQAMAKGRALAEVARDAFRGVDTGGVWFRNVRINKLPPSEKYYIFNVISEYEYSEIGD
jgi:hypothetical protein